MSDLGVVPEGWEVRRLGDLLSIQYGKSPKAILSATGCYPIWGTGGVTGKTYEYLHEGDSIVIGRKGTIDKPQFVTGKFWVIDTAYYASNFNGCLPKWLYYAILNLGVKKYNESTGVPSLNRETIYSIPSLHPPLQEQKKIAEILTAVDAVIEKTEMQISKLRDLKKAMMTELLTKGIGHTEFKDSPVGRIPAVWKVFNAGDFLQQRKEKGEGELPLYSVLLEGGMVPRSSVERRVKSELDAGDNLTVRKGDLAYNMMRMWQGASGISPVDCLVSPAYVVAAPDLNLVTSAYLGFLMKSSKGIRLLHRYSYGLTGDRLRLYYDSLEKIKFALPPVAEQEKIVNVLLSIDERLKTKKQKLTQTKTLKKALMHDLLTGKKRVKVGSD